MINENKKINVEEVVASIDTTLKELKEVFDVNDLSSDDRKTVSEQLEKTAFLAYQIKLKSYLKELAATSPNLPVRDVIIKLLNHISPDTPISIIFQLVKYIAEEWEQVQSEVVA